MSHPAATAAWVPGSPCTPSGCLARPADSVGYVRRVGRCVAWLLVTVAGVVASLVVARMNARTRSRLVRGWARVVVRSLGVRIRVCGDAAQDAPGGELLVANHVSWLDVAVMAAVRPARMVAKSEVRRWPVLGRIVASGGTLFVTRDRPRALPEDVAAITGALRGGAAVAVFPEGSTWCGERHGSFRRAMFQAALDARVPVRPVAIAYRGTDGRVVPAAAFVGEDTLAASVWRVAGVRGLMVEARVLPAIDASVLRRDSAPAARRELAAAAHEAVSEALRAARW